MNIRQFFQRFARKSHTFRTLFYNLSGAPSWSSNDITQFVQQGFAGNPYVYAALTKISTAVAEAPPMLFKIRAGSKMQKSHDAMYDMDAALSGRSQKKYSKTQTAQRVIKERASRILQITGCSSFAARGMAIKALVNEEELEQITSHPILDLLSHPNGFFQTTYSEFVHAWTLSMLISGEAFTEPRGDGEPDELFILPTNNVDSIRPVRTDGKVVNPLPGFKFNTTTLKYSPDPIETEVFFAKFYDPVNPLRGLSPMNAAIRSIDLNNSAREYNFEFMKNAGMPPALITGEFDEVQREAIEEDFAEKTGGPKNAGRILTLAGKNMKYHQLSVDAAKLQWAEVLTMTMREIAAVYNIAPELLGDGAAKTFNNVKEARLALYQDNALPLTEMMYQHWNQTWVKRFDDDVFLALDADQILAIQDDIQKIYDRLEKATWLSINEKRTATKLPTVPGGDVILIPLNVIPLDAEPEPENKTLLDTGEGDPYFTFTE